MPSALAQELGLLAHGLTPEQRTLLQRLLGEFLTSIPEDDDMPGAVELIRSSSTDLRELLGLLRHYTADHDSNYQPFQISFPTVGSILVDVSPRISTWTDITSDRATSWATGAHAGSITVNLQRLPETTSTVLAWLVQIATRCPSKHIWLMHCSPTIKRSIHILRVGRLLKVLDADPSNPLLSMT